MYNTWTPEVVTAEMDYRLERARAAAVVRQAREGRPSWLRRLLSRSSTPRGPVGRMTPALP